MVMTTIVRDQAGLHVNYYETSHYKEGTLDLSFRDPADQEHVKADDEFALRGLEEDLDDTSQLKVVLMHADGSTEELPCIAC